MPCSVLLGNPPIAPPQEVANPLIGPMLWSNAAATGRWRRFPTRTNGGLLHSRRLSVAPARQSPFILDAYTVFCQQESPGVLFALFLARWRPEPRSTSSPFCSNREDNMIRKLKNGKYRLYSRKPDQKTGQREKPGHLRNSQRGGAARESRPILQEQVTSSSPQTDTNKGGNHAGKSNYATCPTGQARGHVAGHSDGRICPRDHPISARGNTERGRRSRRSPSVCRRRAERASTCGRLPKAIQGEPNLFADMISRWFPVTCLLNNLNRGLGLPDAYPLCYPALNYPYRAICFSQIGQRRSADVIDHPLAGIWERTPSYEELWPQPGQAGAVNR